jgi:hypothetical protein
MNRDGSRFWWPLLVMAALELHNSHTLSSNQSGVGTILAFFSFFNQISHQKEPEIFGHI